MPCVVRCRKYFNESRYPASDSLVYTRKFSKEFLDYTDKIKDYVEEKCFPKEDISEIFKKQE